MKPNLIEEHKQILEELHEIYKKKNADYGNSFGETYQKLGILSAATRINDKNNRFTSLAVKGTQEVKDESIDDTLMDMANYCIMTLMERRRGKTNK